MSKANQTTTPRTGPSVIPGLRSDGMGSEPAQRRAALRALDDRALEERIVDQIERARSGAKLLGELVATTCELPVGELVSSPFGLRGALLGLAPGTPVVHHELRTVIPWGGELLGPDSVRDPRHGVWDRGELAVGKYESFLHDDVIFSYQPGFSAKWTSHELLHRAAGCLWRADLHPWELYIGARLNELVPVVHWYGLDQIARLEGGPLLSEREARRGTPAIKDARWLRGADEAVELARQAVPLLRQALDHFEEEWDAISTEVETGRRCPVEHPTLDASSDAIAYVAGHRARLEADVTVDVLGLFADADASGLIRGEVRAYRDHVERLFDRLLFDTLSFDPASYRARRRGRVLRDWWQRAALFGERTIRRVRDLGERCRDDIAHASSGGAIDLDAWRAELERRWPARYAEPILAAGALGEEDGTSYDLGQLEDGLASYAPATLELLGGVAPIAASGALVRRSPLPLRVEAALDELDVPSALGELHRFETVLATREGRSDTVEWLVSGVPDGASDGGSAWVIRNDAFEIMRFSTDVASLHAAALSGSAVELPEAGDEVGETGESSSAYLIGRYKDELIVVPASSYVRRIWGLLDQASASQQTLREQWTRDDRDEALRRGFPESAEAWLEELASAGALGLVPHL